MRPKLIIFVLVLLVMAVAGCKQTVYVCADGSVAKSQGACPVEGLEAYEKTQIQEVLDSICDGYLNQNPNLIISTIDPALTTRSDLSEEELLDMLLYPAGQYREVEICKMKIIKASFSSGAEKATVTLRLDFRAVDNAGESEEIAGKSTTFFFIKMDGEWKTTTYDLMY